MDNIRLEADQRPDHPGDSNPRITIENCGTGFACEDICIAGDCICGSDLSVELTYNVNNLKSGDILQYTITVTNNGPINTSNVLVENILPQG